MQILDGRAVFSATDLVGFLACEHLTALELAGAARLVRRPIRPDPELDVIQQRGIEHERRFLGDLEAAPTGHASTEHASTEQAGK